MSLKVSKSMLVLCLTLPVAVTIQTVKAANLTRDLISLNISNPIDSSLDGFSEKTEYFKQGNLRILRVKGNNLNELHSTASKEFISRIEEEIKSPGASLTISNFATSVRYENGEYVFEYSVMLIPAKNKSEAHTLIAMRGTVWTGTEAKSKVLAENKDKIPSWQNRMGVAYPNMKLWYEVAQSDVNSSKDNIFHEAVLVKGVRK